MNQHDATRDLPTDSAFRIDGVTSSALARRAVADPSNVLTIIGAVTSQVVLITAVFYYFGWVRTYSFFSYFGVDSRLLNYSTADYVLRSINVAFLPFIHAALVALVLFGFHRLVIIPALMRATLDPLSWSKTAVSDAKSPSVSRLVRPGLSWAVRSAIGWARLLICWRLGPSGSRRFIGVLQLIAATSGAVVFIGILFPRRIGVPLGIFLPLLLVVSVILLSYIAHLRFRYPDAFAATAYPRPIPPSRRYALILLTLGLIGGLWAVGLYGDHVGTRDATDMVSQLPARPEIVVYSTERITLNGHGITVSEMTQAGTKYHYRYTGLRLLARAPDRFLLLPARWQYGRDRVLVVRDDDSIRIDIAA